MAPHPTNPREIALAIIDRVDRRGAYADVLLNARLEEAALPRADGALLTRMVYGALRWRGRIDWVLGSLLRDPLEDLDPAVRNLLRLGAYELLFLDRVPSYATVNELVETAKRRAGPGKARLVNAVLRRIARREREAWAPPPASRDAADLAVLVSHPRWLVDMWRKQFGDAEGRRLMEANNQEAPLVLRANRLRTSRDALVRRLRSRGVDAEPGDVVAAGGASARVGVAGRPSGVSRGAVPGAGRSLPSGGPAGRPRAGNAGSRRLRRARRQDHAHGGAHGRTAARWLPATSRNAASPSWRRMPAAWGSTASSRGSATRPGTSRGRRAPSTGCWWTRRARVWGPCARIPKSAGGAPNGTCRAWPRSRPASWTMPPRGCARTEFSCTPPARCPASRTNRWWRGFLERHGGFVVEEAAAHLPETARSMTAGPYLLALPHRHDTDGFFAARMRRLRPEPPP